MANQAELRERFNPDGSSLRNHQLRMLEMLKYIDGVCKKHNISYWLSSGTLLGAVRHGGFIPWDDDLDIEMLRKDYLKLVKVLGREIDSKYALQTHKTDTHYLYPFGKLRDLHSVIKETHDADIFYKYKGVYVGTEVCQKASKAERQGCFGERQAEKRKADCPEVVFLVGQIFLDSSLVMGKYS